MRNTASVSIHFNDPAEVTTMRLNVGHDYIVRLFLGYDAGTVLLTLPAAVEVAKQLTSYLAQFSREHELNVAKGVEPSAADVGGFQ